jgi:hypothetical protein
MTVSLETQALREHFAAHPEQREALRAELRDTSSQRHCALAAFQIVVLECAKLLRHPRVPYRPLEDDVWERLFLIDTYEAMNTRQARHDLADLLDARERFPGTLHDDIREIWRREALARKAAERARKAKEREAVHGPRPRVARRRRGHGFG